MRLIDADAVKRMLCGYCSNTLCDGDCEETDALDALPTIDPVKHGIWTKHILKNANVPWGYDCSACDGWFVVGEDVIKKYHFCPNCGAHMERSEDD